jgi:hypothetical protein
MQSNRGVFGIIGLGVVVGLALALGFVFYWQPKQIAEAAQAEINEWSGKWREARKCLVGDNASPDPLEALHIRELLESNLKQVLRECQPYLKVLAREDGASTENQAIEEAWYALRKPMASLHQAFAWMIAKKPNADHITLRTRLAKAINDAEAAYEVLAKAAGMEPAFLGGQRLLKAESLTKLSGPKGKGRVFDLLIRDESIHYKVADDNGTYDVTLASGMDAPSYQARSNLALRSLGQDWGLWLEEDGIPVPDANFGTLNHGNRFAGPGAKLVAGPLDVQGEPAADGSLLYTLAEGQNAELIFATGSEKRIAIFRLFDLNSEEWATEWKYHLRVSLDGGATFAAHDLPDGDIWTSISYTKDSGYISHLKDEQPGALHYMSLTSRGVEEFDVQFPQGSEEDFPPNTCRAKERWWWVHGQSVYTQSADGRFMAVPGTIEESETARYTRCDEEMLSIVSEPQAKGQKLHQQIQRCTPKSCKPAEEVVALSYNSQIGLHHKGRFHSVVLLGNIVALWQGPPDGEPLRMLRLPVSGPLSGVTSRGGQIAIVVWPEDADGPTLIPLSEG